MAVNTDLSDLKNLHENEKCFVIGAGPSLYGLDSSVLEKHVVIAVNSSVVIFKWCKGEPDRRFWVSNDTLCMRWDYFWTQVLRAQCNRVVRTSWSRYDKKIEGHGFRYFRPRKSGADDGKSLSASDGGLCSISSVPTSIDLAILLGCKKIFLLGVDHKMLNAKSHFWQFWPVKKWPKRKDRNRFFRPEQSHQTAVFEKNMAVYKALDIYAKENGVEIYNCTKRSVIKSFPKITLDEALEM